jgi:RTA1 like protein
MPDAPVSLYPFTPSQAAAILFTSLYGTVWASHCFQHLCLRRRCCRRSDGNKRCARHWCTVPTAVAALLSSAGYGVRNASTQKVNSIDLYAASSGLIVISPIFICASLYLLLSRIIVRSLPPSSDLVAKKKPQVFFGIAPRWIGKVFVASDVLSFMTQGAGTGIAAGGNWEGDAATTGINVLLFGLSLQLATFTVFLVALWMLVCRVRIVEGGFEPKVKSLMVGITVASVFIEIRSVYRVVEFALGIDGYPFQHEWPLYVLEAVPVLFAIAALAWWHPIRLLPEGIVPPKDTADANTALESGVERGDQIRMESKK